MAFEPHQIRKLRAKLKAQHIRNRVMDGVTLRYLEGWHVVAEANRIFGFEGWDRETIEAKCVYTKHAGDQFTAAYVTRIRVVVSAGERRIVREGTGAGEATTSLPGQAHELAAKAAETDATKRALMTFGNAFGLCLYGATREGVPNALQPITEINAPPADNASFRPEIERPRSAFSQTDELVEPPTGRIEKSLLALGEPVRLRSPHHLRYVASRPCAVCGKNRAHAHHLTFAQPRALGRKTSDEFTVPLCPQHHRQLHESGNERKWWQVHGVDPVRLSEELWAATFRVEVQPARKDEQQQSISST